LAVDLPDKQLAVAKDNQILGADFCRSFKGSDKTRIFGNVVRGSAQDEAFCLKLHPGGIR
jgi:hypothetical protein